MAEYNWPCAVLRARDVGFHINERTLGTSPSVSGYTQVVSGGPPIWTATFSNIDLRTQAQRLCWRALSTLIRGRQNIIKVSMCRGDQPVRVGYTDSIIPYSDGSVHSDDSPFAQNAINATVSAVASKFATTININSTDIGDVQAGHVFSIDDRPYQIVGVTNNGSGNYSINIWPPLIKAISIGDTVDFDEPTCRMRLATDGEMSIDFASRKFASPTVRFVQDFS